MVELDEINMDDSSDFERNFVVDCNEVINFKLVRKASDLETDDQDFSPEMSYQVFGKTEKIFGYKDLKISLFYTAGSLRTYLSMSYQEKVDPSLIGLPADNVIDTLSQFLAHEHTDNIDSFVQSLNDEPKFKPAGNLVHRFQKCFNVEETERTFEIYHMNLSNTDSKFFDTFYHRFQRFLIWYIDGASYIEVDDDKWNYFMLYEKYKNENNEECYAVAGVTTVYEYYAYPMNIRPRISQVLVLPPFQQYGMAVQLLETIYNFYTKNENVVDITVEDPTDNFQNIRDYVDLCRCEKLNIFNEEDIKAGFTKDMETKLKNELKIHKKQGRRLYEIMLLKTIDKNDEEQYKQYRILVKNRLNAPFLKTSLSLRRRMDKALNREELECADVFQKPEIRFSTLMKMYNELEEQYEHVLNRYLNKKS